MKIRKPVCIIFLILAAVSLFAEVNVSTGNDEYILPVAELASTKTYPDVIRIRNSFVEIEILPNRGRVIYSFRQKGSKDSFFYSEPRPVPKILESGLHAVEFGGYYLSLPWNTRDRQPFDLNYEITENTGKRATVYLTGRDLFKKTVTECWLTLEEGKKYLRCRVKIENGSSRSEAKFDLNNFFVFNFGEGLSRELLLPSKKVEVISSARNWLGEQGREIPADSRIRRWDGIQDYYIVECNNPPVPLVGMRIPETDTYFLICCGDTELFPRLRVETWGRNYIHYEGIAPYAIVTLGKDSMTLQPKESIQYELIFFSDSGIGGDTSAEGLYARVMKEGGTME